MSIKNLLSRLFARRAEAVAAVYQNNLPEEKGPEVVHAPVVEKGPRVRYTDADGSWEDDRLVNEIKIDVNGKVYFKIDRVWKLQDAITSITVIR